MVSDCFGGRVRVGGEVKGCKSVVVGLIGGWINLLRLLVSVSGGLRLTRGVGDGELRSGVEFLLYFSTHGYFRRFRPRIFASVLMVLGPVPRHCGIGRLVHSPPAGCKFTQFVRLWVLRVRNNPW